MGFFWFWHLIAEENNQYVIVVEVPTCADQSWRAYLPAEIKLEDLFIYYALYLGHDFLFTYFWLMWDKWMCDIDSWISMCLFTFRIGVILEYEGRLLFLSTVCLLAWFGIIGGSGVWVFDCNNSVHQSLNIRKYILKTIFVFVEKWSLASMILVFCPTFIVH